MAEKTTEKGLTPKQRRCIAALISSGTVADAARAAGVTRTTVYKWRKLPHFAAALKEAESQALRDLARQMAGLGTLATNAIRDALQPEQEIGVRLRAAAIVVDRTPVLAELSSLVERIERLEANHANN